MEGKGWCLRVVAVEATFAEHGSLLIHTTPGGQPLLVRERLAGCFDGGQARWPRVLEVPPEPGQRVELLAARLALCAVEVEIDFEDGFVHLCLVHITAHLRGEDGAALITEVLTCMRFMEVRAERHWEVRTNTDLV